MLGLHSALGLLQAAQDSAPGLGASWMPMLLMFVLAWFLLIRPVQKQRKEKEAMREALRTGEKVLTTGGLYGTITKLREGRLFLKISDGVQVEIARSAVVSVVSNQDEG